MIAFAFWVGFIMAPFGVWFGDMRLVWIGAILAAPEVLFKLFQAIGRRRP